MYCYLPCFNIGCIVVIWYNTTTECDAGIELYCKCGALPSHLGRLERRTCPPVLTGGIPERKDWKFVAGKGFPWISADLGLQLFFRRRISAKFDIWLLLCRQADFGFRWTRWTRWTRSFICKVNDGARCRSNWGRVKSPKTLRLVQNLGHAGLGWVLSARGVLANLGSGEERWRKGSQHESASLARQLVHLRMKRNSRAFQLAC